MTDRKGYRQWNSTLRRRTPLRANKRLRPVGDKKRERWERAYGSEERVTFVGRMECCVPGCENPSECAHLPGSGGMGMKGPYTETINLCPRHHRHDFDGSLHDLGSVERFDAKWKTDLRQVAKDLQRKWRERDE
ncbi:MAG: hypothetical protein GWN53_17465 [Gammaproteobacteria bacterium]|uniref:Uncharacterized protein n=1 Tax=Candidatus Kutchimonas denitrificans TaxID=3056748 RepID=A0AAE5CD19_9BACT|nr:hypothetical protein [Candidatus Kutchimonas denitrificans]NIV53631.1 hypothetical protein [Gammaproteobacteria bacterium]